MSDPLKTPKKINKTQRINFRVTGDEYLRLEQFSTAYKKNISTYCRDKALGKHPTLLLDIRETLSDLFSMVESWAPAASSEAIKHILLEVDDKLTKYDK
jgi:hypothetical protein